MGPNMKIAIVGYSGSGKSEFTELKEKDACCPKDKKMEVEENKKLFFI